MAGNSENQPDTDDLSSWIEALVSESITEAQFQQLSCRLKDDPQARQHYLAELEIESLLYGTDQSPKPFLSPELSPHVGPARSPRHPISRWLGAGLVSLAAAAAIGGVLLYSFSPTWKTPDNIEIVQQPVDASPSKTLPTKKLVASLYQSVARITNSKDATWRSEQPLVNGSWLSPATYGLVTGNAEITFDAGAIVWIAAGTEFEIIDANAIRLIKGSLEADVPEQAIGFNVQTPTGKITDLSTRFSVKVSADGQADIHVLKGIVEAEPLSAGKHQVITLKENSAMRMFADAPPEPVEFSPDPAIGLGSRSSKQPLNYLHFSFDETSVANDIIPNDGPGAAGQGGEIAKGDVENSWLQVDGKIGKSLYFSGEGARIKTQIKGVSNTQPRTIMFWVRINPETPSKNSYSFVTWGKPEIDNDRGKKWQIGWNPNYTRRNEGTMGAIRTEFGGGFVIGTTDLRDGRWHHVTSVYIGGDASNDVATSIRHYVDGKLESVSGVKSMKINTQSDQRTMAIGEYIGGPVASDFFRTYKGWIDEFYLFDVALTPKQIVQVMNQNLPPAPTEVVFPAQNEN